MLARKAVAERIAIRSRTTLFRTMNTMNQKTNPMLPEHLTSDEQGNVAWRGTIVDNLSCTGQSGVEEHLADLARRCGLLEEKGFPVTDHTVAYQHCYDAEPGTPWQRALCHLHRVYQRPDGLCAVMLERRTTCVNRGQFFTAYAEDGKVVVESFSGDWDLCEAMEAQGFSSAGFDLPRDDTMALLDATGLTVEDITAILDSPH
jgi:hypothetical protein